MNKTYRLLLPLLTLWLVAWIAISWPSVQDDAFIHLRYADNLFHTHHLTFDGIHPNYGASSLLYVCLLAFLRNFFTSPNLPRAVSSAAHLALFGGLAMLFTRYVPARSYRARLLGIVMLLFIAAPSAVRWLDDGMETGLALCAVTLLCWVTFRQSRLTSPEDVRPSAYLAGAALGFLTVILRTELVLLCAIATCILIAARLTAPRFTALRFTAPRATAPDQPYDRQAPRVGWYGSLLASTSLLAGGLLALLAIVLRMHVLLPDTALAKSHGLAAWRDVFTSTPIILAGALSFGFGLLIFWLVTMVLLLRARRLSLQTLLANSVFPITFVLAVLRGQEIQGARYLAWTFIFSILWNTLELAFPPHYSTLYPATDLTFPARPDPTDQVDLPPSVPSAQPSDSAGIGLIYALLVLFLVAQPIEAKLMYRVLTLRARTVRIFESQHLERLDNRLGMAFDVGYIGFFSRAQICDLAGLVNGRVAARMTNETRAVACAARHPDFIFANPGQIGFIREHMPLDRWQVCGRYDLINLRQPDSHFLLLPRTTAATLCREITGQEPSPLSSLDIPPA